MSPDVIIELTRAGLFITLFLSAPIVIATALIGLLVGFLQAITSIQDPTVGVVFKILAVGALIAVLGSWIGSEIGTYAERVFSYISKI